MQTFTAVKRPHDGISLLVRMFTALRRLHYGALRQSMDVAARQPELPSTKKGDGIGSDELLRIFRRLRDEQREALILAVASGLSYEQAAEISSAGQTRLGAGYRRPGARYRGCCGRSRQKKVISSVSRFRRQPVRQCHRRRVGAGGDEKTPQRAQADRAPRGLGTSP